MRAASLRLFAAMLALAASLHTPDGFAAEVKKAEAISGEPFGVATVQVTLGGKFPYDPDVLNFRLTEKDGRALYPVYTTEQSLLSTSSRLHLDELRVDFLFQGAEPLELTLQLRDGTALRHTLAPQNNPQAHADALRRWGAGTPAPPASARRPTAIRPSWRTISSRCSRRASACTPARSRTPGPAARTSTRPSAC